MLADAADDEGICWPRISTIAERVGVSTRTVQRAIQYLVQHKLVTVEPRLRSDGSSSSNLYRLRLREGDNLSPPPDKLTPAPDTRVTQGCRPCHRGGDTGVTPLTTRRTIKEPPLPQGLNSKAKLEQQSTRHGRGGRNLPELHVPKTLLPAERAMAKKMIGTLEPPLDQQVLDEWAAIIAAGDIRASPLGCLRALVDRAREGKFTPERGMRTAQAREAKRRAEDRVTKLPELAPPNPDSPLVRRLQNMAQRQGERSPRT